MIHKPQYNPTERAALWTLAAVGFVAVNGLFLYGATAQPEMLRAAVQNPVAMAFLTEALLLLVALAYLLHKWGVSRLHWAWFIVLSLVGSMAFALPIILLWKRPKASGTTSEA